MADTLSSKRKSIGWYVMIVKLYEKTYPEGTLEHGMADKFYKDLTQAQQNIIRVHHLIWDYMEPSERICLLLSHAPYDVSLSYFSSELDQ